ncbi:uncharacterized protein [Littorina saxatilis]|uniref:uncharacterized protein n=1 Tax=Littorina saxatilis TaxID=31220 RepID=UPI0038B57E31
MNDNEKAGPAESGDRPNPKPSSEQANQQIIQDLMQQLDAKWEKRFAALSNPTLLSQQSRLQAQTGPELVESQSEKPQGCKRKGASAPNAKKGKTLMKKRKVESNQPESNGDSESDSHYRSDSSDGEILVEDDVLSIVCSDEDLMKEIDGELDREEITADAVASSMADLIDKRFAKGLGEDKFAERIDLYPRPINCQKLQVPKVNTEVWKLLPVNAKKADLKLASIQRAVIKAATAVTSSTQALFKAQREKSMKDGKTGKAIVKANSDALAMLGHAGRELSLRRRYALRPHLPKHMIGLCSDSVPISSQQLFGDNLSNSLKEAKELDRYAQSTGANVDRRGFNFKPWKNNGRKPFLGMRQPQWQNRFQSQKRQFGGKNSQRAQFPRRN